MTSLRFVGDLPVWLGLVLALLVGILAWSYYRRESIELPRTLRWLLPMLRVSAFFLGIMILTGPVLHHRTVIGELGQVKIYLDASSSMTLLDRQMPTGRKLLIGEQLGWLPEGKVDRSLLDLAAEIAQVRTDFAKQLESETDKGDFSSLRERLTRISDKLPSPFQSQFQTAVLEPLDAIENTTAERTEQRGILDGLKQVETALLQAFDESIQSQIQAGDDSLQVALTMFDESTRWQRLQLALLQTSDNIVAQLREHHEVEVFLLAGENAEPVLFEEMESASEQTAPVEPDFSSVTDLSSGITATQKTVATVDSAAESPSARQTAIVLLTDGQHNFGPSPIQTSRVLGTQGVGFFPVGTGATSQAPDLAVVSVEAPEMVFKEDRVQGILTLRDRVEAGKPFVAQIGHADQILWQQELLTEGNSERRIEFDFSIEELVEQLGEDFDTDVTQHALPISLTASVSTLPEESETDNNQQTLQLAVVTQSYKLLLIDGRSRWETRYLRNVFERDEQWEIDTIIAGPGTDTAQLPRGDQPNQFPANRDQLFEYDLIVVGELSSDLLTEVEYEWIREFVEIRGGGAIFIDGQRGKLAELAQRGLDSLLPVEWLPEPIPAPPTSLQLTESGKQKPALRLLADGQQNAQFWTELPPPHTPVAVKELPGADVLIETTVGEQTYPVMVTRQVGAGRVLYLAFDETWRWRYKVADTWHQRIWNQLAIDVMPRPFAVSDEYVSIDSGPLKYTAGETVSLRVRLLNLAGKPTTGASVEALLWKQARVVATVTLSADPDVPGIYRGQSEALSDGDYEVSIRAAGYSDSVLKARTQFVVSPPTSAESIETAVNESLLQEMATSSGGTYLREEQLNGLPELLAPYSSGRVTESDTPLWQSYWWFSAIILLLTVEWILRKRAGLL